MRSLAEKERVRLKTTLDIVAIFDPVGRRRFACGNIEATHQIARWWKIECGRVFKKREWADREEGAYVKDSG